jgi:3-methyl-2-oxobutanoate hydroxymethyltransferase
MLTAYDYPTGVRCERANIDITLVGDSLAQVALGYDSTTRLTLDEMLHHIRAVARGSRAPLLVADMPFGTYYASVEDGVRSAVRIVREGGAEAVKIEGGKEVVPVIKALTSVGIPVMGHVGLLPQRHTAMSGYRVQGRDAASAIELVHAANELQLAGAFSIVLEAVPHTLAAHITQRLHIPTIGIGAGPRCDGQVLVQDDALGIWSGHKAKFVRRFADVGTAAAAGVDAYAKAVKDASFPSVEESYEMNPGEWEKFAEHEHVRANRK